MNLIDKVVLATRNKGKTREFKTLLCKYFQSISSLRDLDDVPQVIEDGKSFRENALKKARIIAKFTGGPSIADDSGLVVEVLGGSPGIFSARYAGENAGDKENIKKLLSELRGVYDRRAKFVCSLALVTPGGYEIVVEGTCSGIITDHPRGENGFGYDPVFFLPDLKKTMAQLSDSEKNKMSHRAKAVEKLVSELDKQELSS